MLNDKYFGPEAWERFLTQIELPDPPIRALGITDYVSVERYQQGFEHKVAGRRPGVSFIFPNVELRLDISMAKGSGVNLQLLFDSQAANCITEINHFLLDLFFPYLDRKYRYLPSDLIKLGRAHRPE